MKRTLPSLWGKLQKRKQTTFLPRGEAQESSQEQGVLELGCYTGESPSALILGQLLPKQARGPRALLGGAASARLQRSEGLSGAGPAGQVPGLHEAGQSAQSAHHVLRVHVV